MNKYVNINININKSKWDINDIRDQKGRIFVVTGATSGIGKETARILAKKNGKVILGVRNMKKGEAVTGEIRQEYPRVKVSTIELDLANLE